MNCDRYHNWIKDAAVDSLDPGRKAKLSAHLANCPGCREFLAEEQQLVAGINRGIERDVKREPSPDFSTRVRLRLAQEGEQNQSQAPWFLEARVSLRAAGVLLLALVSMTIWFLNRPAPPRQVESVPLFVASVAVTTPARQAKEPQHTLASPTGGGGSRRVRTEIRSREFPRSRGKAQTPDTRILVQPGQWAAIAHLSQTMQPGGVFRSSQLGEVAAWEQPIEVKSIKVQPIKIEPVEVREIVVDNNLQP